MIFIMLYGYPATGKTTSARKLNQNLSADYNCLMLSTLDYRKKYNLFDLYSEEQRNDIYNYLLKDILRLQHNSNYDVIIIDGNYNKYSRRKQLYDAVCDHELYVVNCFVTNNNTIQDRLKYRQQNIHISENKASTLGLYELIKRGGNRINDDPEFINNKFCFIKYNTDNNTTFIDNHKSIIENKITHSISDILIGNINKMGDTLIKAIIFDIGGVIQGLDWSPVVNSILDLNKAMDIYKFKKAFYHDREKFFDLYSTNKMDASKFWGMVANNLDIDKVNIDRISSSFELIYSFTDQELLEFIKDLKWNYKLFILSNACQEIENKVIKDNKYVYLFDKMYFSHNINYHKPEHQAYEIILNENNLSANECVFIDNDIVNIRSAKELGMNVILYKGIEALKREMYEILHAR